VFRRKLVQSGFTVSLPDVSTYRHQTQGVPLHMEQPEFNSAPQAIDEQQKPMVNNEIRQVLIRDLVSEDGAEELLSSPDMHPYVRLLMTGLLDEADIEPHLGEIAELPLERRYVWRIASALKWGFADFESINVEVDRETLGEEDFLKMAELL